MQRAELATRAGRAARPIFVRFRGSRGTQRAGESGCRNLPKRSVRGQRSSKPNAPKLAIALPELRQALVEPLSPERALKPSWCRCAETTARPPLTVAAAPGPISSTTTTNTSTAPLSSSAPCRSLALLASALANAASPPPTHHAARRVHHPPPPTPVLGSWSVLISLARALQRLDLRQPEPTHAHASKSNTLVSAARRRILVRA